MQHLLKISFIRNRLYQRAVADFVQEQETKGVLLRNEDIPERLCGLRTALIDASLVMEGNNAVRCVAAPLEVCGLQHLKHQGAWMVLTAAVSLGCEGYAPLENFATGLNFARERMLRQYPQVLALPYDDERCIETTVHRDADGLRAYAKGDAAALLARCTKVLDGRERLMDDRDKLRAMDAAKRMEAAGLDTLAFATRWMKDEGEYEEDMVFLGIVGMGDLPSQETPKIMDGLRAEGIRPILVSENDMSAGAVRSTGVLHRDTGMMGAWEMDELHDIALREAVRHADAYIGMDWRHEDRLAHILRAEGTVAAITREPNQGGIVLALGKGTEPDAVLERGRLRDVIRLLKDCQRVCQPYRV